MRDVDQIHLVPTASEVARFNTWFDRKCAESGVRESLRADLKLCVNEVLANLISYGLRGISDPKALIKISLEPDRASATIIDNGTYFDLSARSSGMPDPSAGEPGGYGIALIKERASRLRYTRADGENRLEIVCQASSP